MFKDNQPTNETETIIGPSVRVEGDFITEGNIVVQGAVCGTIKTARDLKVGPKSKIFANINAENATVAGEVQGNIKVNGRLELTSTAKIFGDIRAETLILAACSMLNGRCQMGNQKDRSSKPDFSKQSRLELQPTSNQESGSDSATRDALGKKIKK